MFEFFSSTFDRVFNKLNFEAIKYRDVNLNFFRYVDFMFPQGNMKKRTSTHFT